MLIRQTFSPQSLLLVYGKILLSGSVSVCVDMRNAAHACANSKRLYWIIIPIYIHSKCIRRSGIYEFVLQYLALSPVCKFQRTVD